MMSATPAGVFDASGRRVITGQNPSGQSIFFEDACSESRMEMPGVVSMVDLWRMERIPAVLDDNESPTGAPILNPPSGGLIARLVGIPPRDQKVPDELFASAFEEVAAASNRAQSDRHPGMHKTPTVDLIYIVSGEVYAVLDEGEKLLKAGDLLVQRGTSHAWDNRATETCYMLAVLVSAGVGDE
jgi:mannose-6-phosphate isomerase-like protein (cupin superfamily)